MFLANGNHIDHYECLTHVLKWLKCGANGPAPARYALILAVYQLGLDKYESVVTRLMKWAPTGERREKYQQECEIEAESARRVLQDELQSLIGQAAEEAEAVMTNTLLYLGKLRMPKFVRDGAQVRFNETLQERLADQLAALLVFKNLALAPGSDQTWWEPLLNRVACNVLIRTPRRKKHRAEFIVRMLKGARGFTYRSLPQAIKFFWNDFVRWVRRLREEKRPIRINLELLEAPLDVEPPKPISLPAELVRPLGLSRAIRVWILSRLLKRLKYADAPLKGCVWQRIAELVLRPVLCDELSEADLPLGTSWNGIGELFTKMSYRSRPVGQLKGDALRKFFSRAIKKLRGSSDGRLYGGADEI
jgi:hypothetical protein